MSVPADPGGPGDPRRERRAAAHARTVRQRRLAAAALLIALVLVVALLAVGLGGGGDDDGAADGGARATAAQAPPPKPIELPTGGRTIFPDHRVVAYYGAPQSDELGALGIGTPAQAVAKLRRQAKPYERRTRPVLLALELISTIATAAPGESGLYRSHQSDAVIRRYHRAARRAKALLVLDVQPGRDDFFSEAVRLRRWLREPDVGLALDPEWRVGPGQVPAQVIGSVTAREVNATSAYVARIVKRGKLPEKLFLIHQFTSDMIQDKARVKKRAGLAVTFNVDGFGSQANKLSKWDAFTSERVRFNDGYKLFYKEDTDLMSPRQVMRMQPRPDLVLYE